MTINRELLDAHIASLEKQHDELTTQLIRLEGAMNYAQLLRKELDKDEQPTEPAPEV